MHQTRALYLSLLLPLTACGDDGDSGPGPLGASCRQDTSCTSGLVCEFGLCHQPCATDSNCPGAERCVRGVQTDDAGASRRVCQLDETSTCTSAPDCLGKQVCSGLECRDECTRLSDCAADQTCAANDRCYSTDPSKDAPDGGA